MDARLLMDSPRDRMVEAAIEGMRASGLAGAGINQVIAASGAPKGSLYHYFPRGKLQLAAEALERFGERQREQLAAALVGDAPADERLKRLFGRMAKGLAKDGYRRGCAVAAVSLDLQDDSQELAPVCAAQIAAWSETIAAALEPLPPARRKLLGRLVVTAFEGALVQARALRDPQPLLDAGEWVASTVRAEFAAR
jgi:TetR/AcrR family transcriptional repressor of lmrAB and yxaGH operons